MLDRLWTRLKHGKIHTADSPDDICVICYENWTNTGPHGLSSLPCGHLFGYSCIHKWLQDHDRCPECNAITLQRDIRQIRARNLKVIDNTNEEILKREIKELKEENDKLKLENSKLASQNQLLFVGGVFLVFFVGYLLFFVTSMQIFLDPAEKSANAETPDTIFEPVRAIGIIVELLFSLVAVLLVPFVTVMILFVQQYGAQEGYRQFVQTVQSLYIRFSQ